MSFERKGDIFEDGERIEERARLEDHGDAAAKLFKLGFGEVGDVLAVDEDAAGVGLEEAEEEF